VHFIVNNFDKICNSLSNAEPDNLKKKRNAILGGKKIRVVFIFGEGVARVPYSRELGNANVF
jgi:hypothetical protein